MESVKDPKTVDAEKAQDMLAESILPVDFATDNEYLIKEQKKFYALQWREQLFLQMTLGAYSKVPIGGTDYKSRTVSFDKEQEIVTRLAIWNRIAQVAQVRISETDLTDVTKIQEFKKKIEDITKEVSNAEKEYFTTRADAYFGIPEKTALDNKEMIEPFLDGRKYLMDLKVMGDANKDVENGKPLNLTNLRRLISILTDKHYQ